MTGTLPVPIEFALPDGWRSVPPGEAGTPNVAFVALHPGSEQHGFTPNITLSGEVRAADDRLADVADEAVERMRGDFPDLELGKRTEMGSAADPGLTQAVRMSVPVQGRPREVVQYEMFLGMRDQSDERRMAVLHIALTALTEQFDQVIGDFGKFVGTIEVEHAP